MDLSASYRSPQIYEIYEVNVERDRERESISQFMTGLLNNVDFIHYSMGKSNHKTKKEVTRMCLFVNALSVRDEDLWCWMQWVIETIPN